jgi:hypothetical protein
VRSALEKAEEKRAVPGAAALLRELRAAGHHRICFISGSPRQMRKVLEQKLSLDGVEFDEFILKPNMSNLLRGRFRAIRDQVGYKLPALLAGRVGVEPQVPETLFGDDAEGDAFIYSLYADICAGAVDLALVERVLTRVGAYPDVAERTLTLSRRLPQSDCVRRIFIHLDKRSPPARFDRYGGRVVPIFNYFQTAAVLYQDGVLAAPAVVRIALDMIGGGYEVDALCNSFQDLVRRGRLARESIQRLGGQLADLPAGPLVAPPGPAAAVAAAGGDIPNAVDVRAIVQAVGARVRALGNARVEARSPERVEIDYLASLEEDPPQRGKPDKRGGKRRRDDD